MATNVELTRIVAPTLTSSTYGSDIRKRFEDIDNNFRILANHGFVKGNDGDDIRVENVIISSADDASELSKALYQLIIDYVNSNYDQSILAPVETPTHVKYNWDDCFIDATQSVGVYYKLIDSNVEDIPENRLYINSASLYLLRDRRFDADVIKAVDRTNYHNIEEISSAYYFYVDGEQNWKLELINSFPTLYFDVDSQAFCWKFNGQESGIRAQGVQGEPGSTTPTWIVRCDSINGEDYRDFGYAVASVSQILIKDETESSTGLCKWITRDDEEWDDIVAKIEDNSAAIVLGSLEDDGSDDYYDSIVFLSNIIKLAESNDIRVTLRDNILQLVESNQWLYDALINIKLSDDASTNAIARGLFLPIAEGSKNAHMLYRQAQTVSPYGTREAADVLHIAPITDYDNPETSKVTGSYSNAEFENHSRATLSVDYPCMTVRSLVANSNSDPIILKSGSGAIGVTSEYGQVDLKAGADMSITASNLKVNITSSAGIGIGVLVKSYKSTFEGDLVVRGGLTVRYNANIRGDLTVDGSISAQNGKIKIENNNEINSYEDVLCLNYSSGSVVTIGSLPNNPSNLVVRGNVQSTGYLAGAFHYSLITLESQTKTYEYDWISGLESANFIRINGISNGQGLPHTAADPDYIVEINSVPLNQAIILMVDLKRARMENVNNLDLDVYLRSSASIQADPIKFQVKTGNTDTNKYTVIAIPYMNSEGKIEVYSRTLNEERI